MVREPGNVKVDLEGPDVEVGAPEGAEEVEAVDPGGDVVGVGISFAGVGLGDPAAL